VKNDYETEEDVRAQQRAVEPLINKLLNELILRENHFRVKSPTPKLKAV
jgi:hypothetical protein